MRRRFSLLSLTTGLLIGSMNASTAAAAPQVKSHIRLSSMLMTTEPISTNPITGRQVCHAVQVVTGTTTLWLIVGRTLPKWVSIPVYGTSLICTFIYD
jgi:hypothetical protein